MTTTNSGNTTYIKFSRFKLERHVKQALDEAWILSGGAPLNAALLLKGVLQVAKQRKNGSQAFNTLAALLPLKSINPPAAKPPPLELAALPVTPMLAQSSIVAEKFLEKEQQTVWGRDFITLALLTRDDYSLDDLASQAGKTLDSLRVDWFNYLVNSEKHRIPEVWAQWWRSAGFVPPQNIDLASASMPAYLLVWNPELFSFPSLEEKAAEIVKMGSVTFGWSSGNRKSLQQDARVFLLRVGPEPRGLVGVGEVAGAVEKLAHWDRTKSAEGAKSNIVPVRWTALSREPLVALPTLKEHIGDESIWSNRGGAAEIPPDYVQRLDRLWPEAWASIRESIVHSQTPQDAPHHWIARFSADTGDKEDSLNIKQYVDAFARVMASRNLTPPLSIGLFGDWGSGKTFFMDRLENEIQTLSGNGKNNDDLYWPAICQIRFNAWHYAETDLWASLVSTIFNSLRIYLDGNDEDSDRFNRLMQELEVTGELQKNAKRLLSEAETRLHDARQSLEDAKQAQAESLQPAPLSTEEIDAILAKTIEEVTETSKENISQLLISAAQLSGHAELQSLANKLNNTEIIDESREVFEQFKAISSRSGFWWRILCRSSILKSDAFIWTIAILILIPITFILLHWKIPEFGNWSYVLATLGEVVTILGGATSWVRSQFARAAPVLDQLDALQSRIEDKIRQAHNKDREEQHRQLTRLEQERAKAQKRLEEAEQALREAEKREERARTAVKESTSTARLGKFIRQRASSADYEKHLGLIAMIHRDFEKLSKLMTQAHENKPDDDYPRIDRIILYIDDLDRCYPPRRVVRVLEAVHLLLFFPLFVVVVGVDSRWISRSLNKYYQSMLGDESADSNLSRVAGQPAPAASQDFLEKIFQVPFWLRRMDPSAVRNMIRGQMKNEISASSTVAPPDTPVDIDEEPPIAAGDSPDNPNTPDTLEAEDAGRASAKFTTKVAETESVESTALAIPTETLKISNRELDFMDQVAPLMPRTPRSVKRFVNIYRLYKASLSSSGYAQFMGAEKHPGNFRAVQILLALVIGTPKFAQQIFRELENGYKEADKKALLSDLVNLEPTGEKGWRTTLDALQEFAKEKNNIELDDLRAVAPLVSRYSLHHMVSETPGETSLG